MDLNATDLQARLDREEQSRRDKREMEDFARQHATSVRVPKPVYPVNPRRAEDVQHRTTVLPSPAAPAGRPKSRQTVNLAACKFYCWKEGKAGHITFAISGDFTEDP